MRKITLLMCFVLCTVFGLRAQNVTLPYIQLGRNGKNGNEWVIPQLKSSTKIAQ